MDVPRNPQFPPLPSVDSLFKGQPESTKTEGEAKVNQLGQDFIHIDQPSPTSIPNDIKPGSTENVGDLKTQYKALVNKDSGLRKIGNKALALMDPMIKMSPSFEAKFYKNMLNMLVILKNPDHAKTFSTFLDVNFASRADILEIIKTPNQKFKPEIYSTPFGATVDMKIITMGNDELSKFVESINDFCTQTNTQSFAEYIENGLTQKGEHGNKPLRVGEIDPDAVAKDDRISLLNSLNYYHRNDLEYCTHDISKIVHTNDVGVPDKVKFTGGKAVLGASNTDINMVETDIELDVSSFLAEGKNKEESLKEAKALFSVFQRLASNVPIDRDDIWEKEQGKLGFLNDQQKVELKEHFSKLLGKDAELGEMDRKLAALIFVSSPENRKELIAKGLMREPILVKLLKHNLDPKILSFLGSLENNATETTGREINDVDRLLGQINAFLSNKDVKHNELIDFLTSYLEKKEDVIQKRDILMKGINEHKDRDKYMGISRFALEICPS